MSCVTIDYVHMSEKHDGGVTLIMFFSCRRKENAEENAYFLDDLLTDVKDVSFYFYRVTENFNPTSAFSRIDLNMAPFKSTDGAHIGIKAEELYKLNQITATGENRDAVHFICTCKDIPWPPFTQMSEHTAFIEISRQILAPISGKNEVILDRTYRNLLKDLVTDSRLTSDCIGFGSSETWHGSPDARVRGTEIIGHNFIDDDATEPFGSDNDEEISDTCSNVSTGTTTTIETKHLQQLVATCVVSSFIENNLQKKLPSMVPSILIDANGFSICFYDCVDDILLISQTIQLLSKTNRLSSNGVLLLWLTINHR